MDYLPTGDAGFNTWQGDFVAPIAAAPATYGLTAAEAAELTAAQTDWIADYAAHSTAQNAAHAAAQRKDDSRDAFETVIRSLARRIQGYRLVTAEMKKQLGITVPDTTKTPLSEQIVLDTPPPVIKAKCTASKTVRIDWYPDQAPGESEALPQGIDGVNIWVAEGGIPSDESQWRFLAMDTNSPYVHNVGNDSTMTLAYKAQWFDRRKRLGPFCDPTVVAVTP
jgi:hypothetical protein